MSKDLTKYFTDNPTASLQDAADEIGIEKYQVDYQLRKLIKAGIFRRIPAQPSKLVRIK